MASGKNEVAASPPGHPEDSNEKEPVTSENDARWVEKHNAAPPLESSFPQPALAPANEAEPAEDSAPSAEGEPSTKTTKADKLESHNGISEPSRADGTADAPPLPEEEVPPLPEEAPPVQDDGWQPVWEEHAQAYYFYNRFTGATQWDNPRVPTGSIAKTLPPGVDAAQSSEYRETSLQTSRPAGGYDPSIHGDYDPNAWYAQDPSTTAPSQTSLDPSEAAAAYAATGAFNRFTGRWQAAEVTPENYNDENKSKRQMNAFFDVDAAANSHDGRSLKAERSGKKLSKQELKQFKEKRKAKKEEKRRAWLRD